MLKNKVQAINTKAWDQIIPINGMLKNCPPVSLYNCFDQIIPINGMLKNLAKSVCS